MELSCRAKSRKGAGSQASSLYLGRLHGIIESYQSFGNRESDCRKKGGCWRRANGNVANGM